MENTEQVQNPASQSLPVQPVEQKPYQKKNWIKWILVVFFLILLIAIPATAYYLSAYQGKFCGGYAANLPENQCPLGYTCQSESEENYPDAGGKCTSILANFSQKPTPTISPIQSVIPTPTPEPTANWKTLINNYGFSLKYPPEIKILAIGIQVDKTNAPEIIISKNPDDEEYQEPFLHISVVDKKGTVYKDKSLESIARYDYEANQANKNTFVQLIAPLSQSTLDNQPAYTFTMISKGFSGKWSGWGGTTPLKLKVVEIENNDRHFTIVYTIDDSTQNQILQTFKFTDQ